MKRAFHWCVELIAVGVLGVASFSMAATTPPRQPQGAAVAGQEVTLTIDAAKSKVNYSVESTVHTVHGTFALKDGSEVRLNLVTGRASGEVMAYATSGESGNNSRDQRMHKEILETQRYPDFVFQPSQIDGTLTRVGASDVNLRGVMLIHGGKHEIVARIHSELGADQWKGTAKFDVPYIQWGIKDPSNWLLKVKPVVHVEVDMVGTQEREK